MEFVKELTTFNNKLQKLHRATRIAKLWASAMRKIMSGNKIMNRTMESANLAAHKVQHENADDEEVKMQLKCYRNVHRMLNRQEPKPMMF